jgi:hypothetical protein
MNSNPENLTFNANVKVEKLNSNDIVKSVYAFEFLGLNAKDAIEENDLETALLDNLQEFMTEMG